MKNIFLFKPVILHAALGDMQDKHRATALDLLSDHKYLTVDETGFHIADITEEHPKQYFYGSEAVLIYRQMLGYPDRSVTEIDVMDILEHIEDFGEMNDILYFLQNVEMRNERLYRLQRMNVPAVIMRNEYRQLYECVNYLQDNDWCDKPKINRFDVPDEDGNTKHHEEERSSLSDIGYYLSILPGLPLDIDG